MSLELPRFKCHKEVRAAKIVGIEPDAFSGEKGRLLLEGNHARHESRAWHERHKPEVGGYYVVYEDGYASYSPAKAFEEGYTRIE